jgi:antitoxin VapB
MCDISMVYTKMKSLAKLFPNGRSQAVRLPVKYRFEGTEVFIEKDPNTGNLILSPKPHSSWDSFLALRNQTEGLEDFMTSRVDTAPQERDIF